MKVRWIIIAVVIIIISLFASIAAFANNENGEEVSVEEAKSLLYHAVAYAQVSGPLTSYVIFVSSEGICRASMGKGRWRVGSS